VTERAPDDAGGRRRIVAFATKGAGSNDEARLRALLERFDVDVVPFDRSKKARMFVAILRRIWSRRDALVVMEGTGIAGGAALLLGRLLRRTGYVVGTGDAVGPFMAARSPWLGGPFGLYERLLYRCSAGVIAWTPYLVGRALTFRAPRAISAAGWAPYSQTPEERVESRARIRRQLDIPADALVIGIAGSLPWNARVRYCYGAELVHAIARVARRDVRILIVGDGTGRKELERITTPETAPLVRYTGAVAQGEVPAYLAAMDVGSLPQSVDALGGVRYTTKLSEYLAAGLPIVTGEIPLAYDFGDAWLWRLPGFAPWDPRYVDALARFVETLTPAAVAAKRSAVPSAMPEFDRARQVARVTAFIDDVLRHRNGSA
jgi:hypothetical protein